MGLCITKVSWLIDYVPGLYEIPNGMNFNSSNAIIRTLGGVITIEFLHRTPPPSVRIMAFFELKFIPFGISYKPGMYVCLCVCV